MGDSLGIAFSSAVEWVIKRKRRRTPNHRDAVFFLMVAKGGLKWQYQAS